MKKEILASAIIEGSIKKVREILDDVLLERVDINGRMKNGLTLLQLAAREGHPDILRELIERGVHVSKEQIRMEKISMHEKTVCLEEPAYLAAKHGHKYATELLVSCGADLHRACYQALLLKDSAASFILNNLRPNYFSHLFWTIDERKIQLTKKILGNIQTLPPEQGWSLLCLAAFRNDVNLVKVFLKKGVTPNVPYEQQKITNYHLPYTPIYWAAAYNNKEMLDLLITKETPQEDIYFAVYQAMQKGMPSVSDLLIKDYVKNIDDCHKFIESIPKFDVSKLLIDFVEEPDTHQFNVKLEKPLESMGIEWIKNFVTSAFETKDSVVIQFLFKQQFISLVDNMPFLMGEYPEFDGLLNGNMIFYGTYEKLKSSLNKEIALSKFVLLIRNTAILKDRERSLLFHAIRNNNAELLNEIKEKIGKFPWFDTELDFILYSAAKYYDYQLFPQALNYKLDVEGAIKIAEIENNPLVIQRLENKIKIYMAPTPQEFSLFDNLPIEIFYMMVSFLSKEDIFTLKSTCSSIYAVLNTLDVYEKISLNKLQDDIAKLDKLLKDIQRTEVRVSKWQKFYFAMALIGVILMFVGVGLMAALITCNPKTKNGIDHDGIISNSDRMLHNIRLTNNTTNACTCSTWVETFYTVGGIITLVAGAIMVATFGGLGVSISNRYMDLSIKWLRKEHDEQYKYFYRNYPLSVQSYQNKKIGDLYNGLNEFLEKLRDKYEKIIQPKQTKIAKAIMSEDQSISERETIIPVNNDNENNSSIDEENLAQETTSLMPKVLKPS